MAIKPLLTKDFATENLHQLSVYEKTGGYAGFKRALEMQPDELVELVKKSGLRGRGGAGFPTGNKWSFLPKGMYPRYLVCNADESEPGGFKDRYLFEKSPHQVLEGILIAGYAIGCNLAFIYIRGEYLPQTEALEAAIAEARQAGYLGKNVLGKGYDIDVILHRGAGAYICGEETAMLTSLEGYRGEPRLKPPFPAVKGLYGKPTVVNNVETVCNLPHIVLNGADWFTAIGTPTGKGTRLWCMSGHVNRPGNYELENGTPCREGTFWMANLFDQFEAGEAKPSDIDLLLDIGYNIDGRSFCPLGDASTWFPRSVIKFFRDEFQEHISEKGCPFKKSVQEAVA